MKLAKIYFDAFKSLLNKDLEIKHDCIGFVGTNESGKSNILAAINSLGGVSNLTRLDTPKMSKNNVPKLRFQFKLNEKEAKEVFSIINNWRKKYTLYPKDIVTSSISVTYTIRFNKELDKEERFFSVGNLTIDKDALILLEGRSEDSYKLKNGATFIPLSQAIIIRDLNINETTKLKEVYIEMEYDPMIIIGATVYPFVVRDIKPIQLSSFDNTKVSNKRNEFTKEEWKSLLLRGIWIPCNSSPERRCRYTRSKKD